MKRLGFVLTCCIAAAAAAQQTTVTTGTTAPTATTDTTGTAKPADSPLVHAAKASGGANKKMPKKVLTNADVKKSTGKLAVLPARSEPAPKTQADVAPQKGPIEQHQELLHAQDAAAARVQAAEKKVDELEKEARRLEDAYYAENDPTRRDTVIADRFHQTKRQLDDARKELADARDAAEKLKPKS